MRILSRFTTNLANFVHLNATHDVGIGVGGFSIFTDLYSSVYGLQPLNERDVSIQIRLIFVSRDHFDPL